MPSWDQASSFCTSVPFFPSTDEVCLHCATKFPVPLLFTADCSIWQSFFVQINSVKFVLSFVNSPLQALCSNPDNPMSSSQLSPMQGFSEIHFYVGHTVFLFQKEGPTVSGERFLYSGLVLLTMKGHCLHAELLEKGLGTRATTSQAKPESLLSAKNQRTKMCKIWKHSNLQSWTLWLPMCSDGKACSLEEQALSEPQGRASHNFY